MTLGEILRDLIADMDITQKMLADKLSIGASTLGNYFQDNREPDFATLRVLADFFNVSTDYLLDHRTNKMSNHREDEVLRIFNELTRDQQDFFIKQGRLLIKHYGNKKEKIPELKTADAKPKYKDKEKVNGAK